MFYTEEKILSYGHITKTEMLNLQPNGLGGYLSVDKEDKIAIYPLIDSAVTMEERLGLCSLVQKLIQQNRELQLQVQQFK